MKDKEKLIRTIILWSIYGVVMIVALITFILNDQIYGVKVVVEMEDKTTINARIHGSLEPGVNVFEITEEVKDNVRETIKKVVGLEVKNIELFFKKIKNSGKEK